MSEMVLIQAFAYLTVMLLAGTPAPASACSGLPSEVKPNLQKTLVRAGKPDRLYRIYTPSSYNSTEPNKAVLIFHGWGGSGVGYTRQTWTQYADAHGYILVAPDGLKGGETASWTFPGSSDGIGQYGNVTICNTKQSSPNYCYTESCCPAVCCDDNDCRCGWTHCEDNDFEFVIDLIDDLSNYVCVNTERVYAVGVSNGGMFSWSLGQNSITAQSLVGIGSIIGLPHHDYLLGKGTYSDLPVIGIYGNTDCIVPPGNNTKDYTETCDGEGYYYVDANRLHAAWASDHGCIVSQAYTYIVPGRSEVTCETYCDPQGSTPASVDCRADMGHSSPSWTLDVVLKFFEDHAGGGTPSPTTQPTTLDPTLQPTPTSTGPTLTECTSYTKRKECDANGCAWSAGSCTDP